MSAIRRILMYIWIGLVNPGPPHLPKRREGSLHE